MTAVRFQFDGDTYTVHFRYDPRLVDLVKTVPSYARSWDATTKQWRVAAGYAEPLALAMRERGYIVTGLEPPRRVHDQAVDPSWAQILFQRVGHDRVDPVFRALTKVLHPDNPDTGDADMQRELIAARDENGGATESRRAS